MLCIQITLILIFVKGLGMGMIEINDITNNDYTGKMGNTVMAVVNAFGVKTAVLVNSYNFINISQHSIMFSIYNISISIYTSYYIKQDCRISLISLP